MSSLFSLTGVAYRDDSLVVMATTEYGQLQGLSGLSLVPDAETSGGGLGKLCAFNQWMYPSWTPPASGPLTPVTLVTSYTRE
jgi:hypothetical protein